MKTFWREIYFGKFNDCARFLLRVTIVLPFKRDGEILVGKYNFGKFGDMFSFFITSNISFLISFNVKT